MSRPVREGCRSIRTGWRTTLGCLALMLPLAAWAAEAPQPPAEPLPPQAEAAYQDLTTENVEPTWLDEAVFTEISPITIPELGIRLPEDQDI